LVVVVAVHVSSVHGVDVGVGVGEAVGVGVGVGLAVAVGVGEGGGPDRAQYLPPVFKALPLLPPQTIIWLPVQTAVCRDRKSGALLVLVAVQLSVPGSYLPPVFKSPWELCPPQTIIALPVQTAV